MTLEVILEMVSTNRTVLSLAALFVSIGFGFWVGHKRNAFNFFDLMYEGGKLSKISVVFVLGFFFSTWLLFFLAVTGKITEGYFTLYLAAWVTPIVARIVKGDPLDRVKAPEEPSQPQ